MDCDISKHMMVHIEQRLRQAQDIDIATKMLHIMMQWASYTPTITLISRTCWHRSHMPSHLIGIPLQLLTLPIHFMMHRTIFSNISMHMMLHIDQRHKQGRNNEMVDPGSYLPIWCRRGSNEQHTLPQEHMHPEHRSLGVIYQAISLGLQWRYSLTWYIF